MRATVARDVRQDPQVGSRRNWSWTAAIESSTDRTPDRLVACSTTMFTDLGLGKDEPTGRRVKACEIPSDRPGPWVHLADLDFTDGDASPVTSSARPHVINSAASSAAISMISP